MGFRFADLQTNSSCDSELQTDILPICSRDASDEWEGGYLDFFKMAPYEPLKRARLIKSIRTLGPIWRCPPGPQFQIHEGGFYCVARSEPRSPPASTTSSLVGGDGDVCG